jgi:drug/metabolite transporter (DMT)-like permease
VNSRRTAELGLVAVAAIWGGAFVIVQDAVAKLPTLSFLGWRFLAATVVVAIIWRRAVRELPREGWIGGGLIGLLLTLGYVLQTLGLEHTTASNTGFITGLFVVFTPLFAAIILRDRIGPLAWGAAVVSAIGLFLLSGGGSPNTGDLLVLGCAATFALHILATAAWVKRYDPGALIVVQMGVVGVLSIAAAAVVGDLEWPSGGSVWAALAGTVAFANVIAFYLYNYAMNHTTPTRTALILAAEPVFAGLAGYLFNGERLALIAWAGAALIMAAIVVTELAPRFAERRAAVTESA